MRTVTLPGVFQPATDSLMLAELVFNKGFAKDAKVLDLCTGSGVLAVAAALSGARSVSAVDVSRRAVVTARLNALLNGVHLNALRGDLFTPVSGECFDLILANPPYLPGTSDRLPSRGAARAWEGGRDGRLLLDRICRSVRQYLKDRGTLLLVHSSVSGELQTLRLLAEAGLEPEVFLRRSGRLGPRLAARLEMLQARGLLQSKLGKEAVEELLVVVARKND